VTAGIRCELGVCHSVTLAVDSVAAEMQMFLVCVKLFCAEQQPLKQFLVLFLNSLAI